MDIPFARLAVQYRRIKTELDESWREILEAGSFVGGDHVERFEAAFARYCGVRHAVAVGSGTDALALALRAIGIGPGAEVITAANSFVATAEAIVHAGATPVFVDVNPRTFNIDVERIETAITGRTRAIIPVHLYGQPAELDPILELASRKGIPVIEDAAQAHGARYKGSRAGSFGAAGCFSFYPAKNLGAFGDGGAIVTNDPGLAEAARKLRDHGGTRKYQHDVVGYTSRLDTLQAACLLIKLRHLDEWNRVRRERACRYSELLSSVPRLSVPIATPETDHVFHLYVVCVENGERDGLRRFLSRSGVQTQIHYPKPIPSTPAFQRWNGNPFPEADSLAEKILSLPLYPELTDDEIQYVSEAIRSYMNESSGERPRGVPA